MCNNYDQVRSFATGFEDGIGTAVLKYWVGRASLIAITTQTAHGRVASVSKPTAPAISMMPVTETSRPRRGKDTTPDLPPVEASDWGHFLEKLDFNELCESQWIHT